MSGLFSGGRPPSAKTDRLPTRPGLSPTRDERLDLGNRTALGLRAPLLDALRAGRSEGLPVTERPTPGEPQSLTNLNRFDEAFWTNDRETEGRKALKNDYRIKYANILRHGKIDLERNAKRTRAIGPDEWIELNRNLDRTGRNKKQGEWNFKAQPYMWEGVRQGLYTQDQLQRFGNFHLGWTAAALRVSLTDLLSAAGGYQRLTDLAERKIPTARQLSEGAATFAYNLVFNSFPTVRYAWWKDGAAKWATDLGFRWSDNEGDSFDVMEGWHAYHAEHPQ